ncbi:hypothetical protein JK211_14405 [Tatumella sp. JGM130]|uniref:hypothetical protein n=1 Tax=Tatumella sp. JGM130 TaxID=2799797 RepID=UPI001BAFB689|nr:hypothetical protein [Tatumella sp. JGM130]MBS0895206.1 hypothetical protein [Tatumella sp. JGM130]
MEDSKIKEIYELIDRKIQTDPELEDLKEMIDSGFLYYTTEREYLSIDVSEYQFSEDNDYQNYIMTFEEDKYLDFDPIVWYDSEGTSYDEDLDSALLRCQEIGLLIANDYNVDYEKENKSKLKIV